MKLSVNIILSIVQICTNLCQEKSCRCNKRWPTRWGNHQILMLLDIAGTVVTVDKNIPIFSQFSTRRKRHGFPVHQSCDRGNSGNIRRVACGEDESGHCGGARGLVEMAAGLLYSAGGVNEKPCCGDAAE